MKRVLVTGFEPVDGRPVNTLWPVVCKLCGKWSGGGTQRSLRSYFQSRSYVRAQ